MTIFKRANQVGLVSSSNKRITRMATGDLSLYAETSIMDIGRCFDRYMREGQLRNIDLAQLHLNECSEVFAELTRRESAFDES